MRPERAPHQHFAAERGHDFLPIFAHGRMKDRSGAHQNEREKECGSELSHSLSPVLSTTNALAVD